MLRNKNRDFYQLKADLVRVEYKEGSNELVLIFSKRSDPKLSAEKIGELKGFVVVSIKRPGQ